MIFRNDQNILTFSLQINVGPGWNSAGCFDPDGLASRPVAFASQGGHLNRVLCIRLQPGHVVPIHVSRGSVEPEGHAVVHGVGVLGLDVDLISSDDAVPVAVGGRVPRDLNS